MKEKTLFDYWMILYDRKKSILIITLTAMVTAAMLSWFLPKTYEAKSVFFIPQKIATNLFLSKEGMASLLEEPAIPTPVETLQSIYIGFLKSKALEEKLKQRFPEKPPQEWKKDIDFEVTNAFMLTAYVRDKDPKRAAAIANAYPLELDQLLLEISRTPRKRAMQALETQINQLEKRGGKISSSIQSYEEKNMASSLNQQISLLLDQQEHFMESLSTSHVSLNETQKKIEVMGDQMAKESELFRISETMKKTPLIETLERELSDVEVELAGSRVELNENHPQVQSLKAKQTRIKQNIEKEIEKLVSDQIKTPDSFYEQMRHNLVALLVERESLQSRIKGLQEVIGTLQKRITALSRLQVGRQKLDTENVRYKNMLENLYVNLEELKTQTLQQRQIIFVVDKALLPVEPVFPQLILNILVAAATGLIGGIFYAFFMEYVENILLSRKTEDLTDTPEGTDVSP